MTNTSYDFSRGITRDASGRALPIDEVSTWWNAGVSERMPIYRLGDELICAYGWNGEEYVESFRVADRFTALDDEKLCLTPIRRFQDEEREPDEENEDDFELVGFDVSRS